MNGLVLILAVMAANPVADGATCLLRVDAAAVRAMIVAPSASPEEKTALDGLEPAFRECRVPNGEARILALGEVAERWYRKSRGKTDYRMISATEISGGNDLAGEQIRRARAGWPPRDALATCITGYASPTVQRLLDSEPGSSAEALQFEVLAPAMARCTDSGMPARFTKAELRAVFAREFYRNYVAMLPQIERDLAGQMRTR